MAGVVVIGDGASTAEIAARQVPRLARLRPRRVVLRLGWRDLLDGFDESYFHARIVEILDGIRTAAPDASVQVVAIPPLPADARATTRAEFNDAARSAAELRGMAWSEAEDA